MYMFWNRVLEMVSALDADRRCVGQIFELTIQYLGGKEMDCLFWAGIERVLEKVKEDELSITMLDDWLTGMCLYQLGLFSMWGRKERLRRAYICWMNATAKLANMTGNEAPAVNMDDMMAEWKLLGCGYQKTSIHGILSVAATYPLLKQLRTTVQTEARWVTAMRYPMFGIAQNSIETTFGLFTLFGVIGSLILIHRLMVYYPILSLTSDVSRESLKEAKLISYEGSALFQNGMQIFGSRIISWLNLGLWVLALEWLPTWWIQRLLRE